jgi:hypothetical protein
MIMVEEDESSRLRKVKRKYKSTVPLFFCSVAIPSRSNNEMLQSFVLPPRVMAVGQTSINHLKWV